MLHVFALCNLKKFVATYKNQLYERVLHVNIVRAICNYFFARLVARKIVTFNITLNYTPYFIMIPYQLKGIVMLF